MIGSAVFGALLVAGAAAVVSAIERPAFLKTYVAAFLVWTAFGFFRGVRRWQYTSWMLDDFGLRIRRGWLFKSETLVPRARVQHLDIDRGPLERRYGLATLTLYTAGTGHSTIVHSGLAEADATSLRDALIPKDVDVDAI
ncbi:MAG TPA: PH domain-containing protein [Gemmatimonadaceae bacterium]|nr:PH domain-containing protein [Gemmatimonadaceae bacterium]